MPSPAERHAAARERAKDPLTGFRSGYDFPLDAFQERGCAALVDGRSVLVAAPTGAGKTVVGEFAVHLALENGRKCFYTTPIKALSNQKYHDLVRRYGADRVGLLTGDNSINGEAPVVVMTTEVLRNMLYASSETLGGLGYVVMDEVHYLADRFRGPVWEEVIIHLPKGTLLAALSATVSNAEEFGEWLTTVRGDTEIVVDEHRPVPLWQEVMIGDRLLDLFVDDEHTRVNPELVRLAREAAKWSADRGRGRRRGRDGNTPWRTDVVSTLHDQHMLPGITFIFSRAGCDAAVEQCLAAGIRLTTPVERAEVETLMEARTGDIPHDDLVALDYDIWAEGLRRGVAAHHAGLLPIFKEVVEELFQRGLLKMVFATETLALGINMPARTVVLERLVKWNGEAHVSITPGEYTQLTGRAGRRGIDVEGNAVVVWHPDLDPESLAGLASTRTYPLRSSFRPSYNMAVSLIRQMGQVLAREILETSFAQFQADRAVVGMASQIRRNEEAMAGYLTAMSCHLGDFAEYAGIRQEISEVERQASRDRGRVLKQGVDEALRALRRGDVIALASGRRSNPAVVVEVAAEALSARIGVVTLDRQFRRVAAPDLAAPPDVLGQVRLGADLDSRSTRERKALAQRLRPFAEEASAKRSRKAPRDSATEELIASLRASLRRHPCHGCSDREAHARWSERFYRLQGETAALQRRVDSRTHSIARQFDRVCDVLLELGYLGRFGGEVLVTEEGDVLSGIYSDLDLLVAQALREGLWHGLDAPSLASVVAGVVFEGRQREESPRLPGGDIRRALEATVSLWVDLDVVQREHEVRFQRELDLGFVWPMHRWVQGGRLASILGEAELAAGDFVRWARQVIDLLDQIHGALPTDDPLRGRTRSAIDLVDRGIVAYSAVT
ncbi:MAG: DEAD/DEAH box helicase [Actinobacteria bacterium]|nr:DEAD/DEAH box helicase [Actinomycetota bacterium]